MAKTQRSKSSQFIFAIFLKQYMFSYKTETWKKHNTNAVHNMSLFKILSKWKIPENKLTWFLPAKDECLEEDPLEFWLKTPLVDLKEAIHDYWRLKVPLILAPSYGYTSADQPLVQEHFRNALIHPLEAFICGSGNTREVFEVSA